MKKLYILLLILFPLLVSISEAQLPFWHQTNGPQAGTLSEITIDSSGRVILWTAGSGVYVSSDTGSSWKLLNKGLPNLHMQRGEANPSGYLFATNDNKDNQLFRLNENAADPQWEEITPPGITSTMNDIAADPHGELYMAVSLNGVMRSDDNGTTWLHKGNLADTISKSFIDKNVIYLSLDGNGNIFAGLKYGSIFRSSDKGDSWTKLPARDPVGKNYNNLSCLLAAPNGNIILGNRQNQSFTDGGKIYVSSDTGRSWIQVYQRPSNTPERKNNIDKLIKVPGAKTLYANAHGPTLRSDDYGLTWTAVETEKRGDEVFSMATWRNNLFQMCEPDGIFLSTNGGLNWTPKNNGLIAQFMWGIAINSKRELFGITEYGLWRSTDNGDAWDQAPEYGENYSPNIYINKKDYLYIGTGLGLFRSKDNGQTLDHIVINLYPKDSVNTINQVGDNGNGKLFCAVNDTIGFIYSTDDGDNWTKIKNLPDTNSTVKSFAFGVTDTIIATTVQSNFYRSLNQGVTWQTLPDNAAVHGTGQLIIHPDGSYLALVNNSTGGIYRSINGGQNWTRIFPPLELNISFNSYFSMMVDLKGSIIVCTDSGIYHSYIGDTHFSLWYSASSGITANDFPNHYVNASAVVENPETHVFFAASRGLGVFKSIPDLGVHSNPAYPISDVRMHIYPNPFSEVTNISFTLQTRGQASLEVYDALGKRTKTIFNGTLDAGEKNLIFDGRGLPNGSYMLLLREGGESSSAWMTLVK